jgi:hypothetical protein
LVLDLLRPESQRPLLNSAKNENRITTFTFSLSPATSALDSLSLSLMGITGEQQREQDITSNREDPTANSSRKIRKPYTITKSRESWSDIEHDKFIEALQLCVLSYSTSSSSSFACFCALFWLI